MLIRYGKLSFIFLRNNFSFYGLDIMGYFILGKLLVKIGGLNCVDDCCWVDDVFNVERIRGEEEREMGIVFIN